MQYRVCPYCGDHLDPGERCTYQTKKSEAAPLQRERPQVKTTMDSLAELPQKVKSPETRRQKGGDAQC